MSLDNGTLVFSRLERGPWQLVSPTGTLLGDVADTPIDPYAPGSFWMGRLTNGRVGVATETFFWTVNPDLSMPPFGGPDYTPVTYDLFSGGTNGTYIYSIANLTGTDPQVYLIEIDPTDWTEVRTWPIANDYGFPTIAVNPAATIAYYGSLAGPIMKLNLTTGLESTFLTDTTQSGLLCFSDGSIVVGWTNAVKRYNAAGVLLTTYPVGAFAGQGGLAALGTAARNSFWVMGPALDAGVCHMWEFNIDTAAVMNDFELPDDGIDWTAPYAVIDQPAVETTYTICRLRRAPHLNNERKRVFHHRFELDMETGLGLSETPATAPSIRLRYSDDGGHTWSSYRTMSAGAEFAYSTRMVLNRLGSARDRIYEVSTCDDAAWRLLAAYLDVEPGTGN